jgi:very-short-patch-repair endonuclease
MAEHYNIEKLKKRRQTLRNNLSKAEAILWNHLSRKQMLGYKFRRQYSVDQYVIDFYCPRLKLAIEIDGDSHFVSRADERDKARQEHIKAYGFRFLRFTNEDVYKNIDGVCQNIYEEIENLTSLKFSQS